MKKKIAKEYIPINEFPDKELLKKMLEQYPETTYYTMKDNKITLYEGKP